MQTQLRSPTKSLAPLKLDVETPKFNQKCQGFFVTFLQRFLKIFV
jgi:hypothetical protein